MVFFKHFGCLCEYGAIRLAAWIVNCLPFSWALWLAHPAGSLLYLVLSRQRRRALENLHFAFQGKKNEAEIHAIARRSFCHLVEFAIEWLRLPGMAKNHDRSFAPLKGDEKLRAALKKGKGAIVLITHLGNWEAMSLLGGLLIAKVENVPFYALGRPLKNPYLNRYVQGLRALGGLQTIAKGGAVQETLNCLKENAIVCVLIDQRVSEGGIEIDFFGRKALTTSLPALAALRLGVPIFHSFPRRTPDLKFFLEVYGPVELLVLGRVKEDIRANTQKFMTRIEEEIRKRPEEWLWMHNRWRPEHGPKD